MGMQSARWRLVWAIGMAALLASVTAGLLFGAERGRPALPEDLPQETLEVEGLPEEPPAAPEAPEAFGGVEIAAPESGAKLRGVALVKVGWADPLGYIIFRIDDRFAYATTPPYEMRWDTSTALDGRHIIAVDAYDASARYAGASSIGVIVENAVPTPPDGVLLAVRFDEHDLITRTVVARGELSALRADEALPEGFDVLGGELRCELNQSVMDAFYEGASALVRNRVRTASLIVDGTSRDLPELGQYAMVQVSRNGLAIPATAATTKPRLGLAEISSALRDFPVIPGDTWEGPLGAVCDLYTRRAVFVQARHTFEGLRWYRGRECAVITSSYTVPELPLVTEQPIATASHLPPTHAVQLTQMRGGRAMRGMRGMRGDRTGRMPGARGARGTAGRAPGRAAPQRPGAPRGLESARLINLQGTRRAYLTRETGRLLHIEDTVLGEVEFRLAPGQRASASVDGRYTVQLTQMRGGRAMRGMRGMRGGRMGETRRGRAGRAAGPAPAAGRAQRPGVAQAGAVVPPKLDYGFRLTSDLVVR